MTLTFTEEQEQLRSELRRFLADKASSGAVRAVMESEAGHDPAVWMQMAGQMGLQGLALPEEYGGSGYGPVELGIVLEEMGRVLLPGPFFATVALAGQALALAGDGPAGPRWLPGIAEGTVTGTLALAEESGSGIDDLATTASAEGAVTGTKSFVVDGASADVLLVVALSAAGEPGLYAVAGDGPGVVRTPLDALDLTRRLARVEFDSAPADLVAEGADHLRRVLDHVLVALAAEQVGGAQACLDASVEYAKLRVQFGRPIGSFQAIKHKCADMLLEVESSRSTVYHAQSCAADGKDDLAVAAALAAAYCSETYTHAAKENLQIHGGIGYTWEHDAHLHLRRAKSSELLFGTPAHHRGALADLVGI